MKPQDELLFLPLGGSNEIGMNVNLYGCQGKWIMVDLGMTFAHAGLPGTDLVFPDIRFIEDRADDLLGIVLTHGHEDHIGAIPYLASELGVPLYATAFTAELIRHKLKDEGITNKMRLNVVKVGDRLDLGPFGLSYVPLAHSIPEGNALVIETPHGRVFHTGDWKLDAQPIIGKPSTAQALSQIGDDGILAMVGDSTNVFNAESSGSESEVREGLREVIAARGNKGRVVVTSFASNAARLQMLGEIAGEVGRELVIAGRSLQRIIQVGKKTGYFTDFPDFLDFDEAENLPPGKLLIVCTGGQGEPRAALARIASDRHPIKLSAGDLVVYSSKQIPGNELAIAEVQNKLAAKQVDIITDRQARVHVSGHPGRPELTDMYGWIRPRIAVPVHGERRHLEEHARLARTLGVPQAIVPSNGQVIRLAPGEAETITRVDADECLVLDGDMLVPTRGETMTQRRRLMVNGLVVVCLVIDGKGRLQARPEIVVQGVPLENECDDFIAECQMRIEDRLPAGPPRRKKGKKATQSYDDIKEAARQSVRSLVREWTGKKPVVEVCVIDIDA